MIEFTSIREFGTRIVPKIGMAAITSILVWIAANLVSTSVLILNSIADSSSCSLWTWDRFREKAIHPYILFGLFAVLSGSAILLELIRSNNTTRVIHERWLESFSMFETRHKTAFKVINVISVVVLLLLAAIIVIVLTFSDLCI